jgi:hypothetical protein
VCLFAPARIREEQAERLELLARPDTLDLSELGALEHPTGEIIHGRKSVGLFRPGVHIVIQVLVLSKVLAGCCETPSAERLAVIRAITTKSHIWTQSMEALDLIRPPFFCALAWQLKVISDASLVGFDCSLAQPVPVWPAAD